MDSQHKLQQTPPRATPKGGLPGVDAGQARPVDLAEESVAGEEDPGAGMDMAVGPGGLSPAEAGNLGPGPQPRVPGATSH